MNLSRIDATKIPSKSIYIRALILASFCDTKTHLIGKNYGDDVVTMVNALRTIGARIDEVDDGFIVYPIDVLNLENVVDCKDSATTYRFLNAIFKDIKLTGSARLIERVKTNVTSQNYSGYLLREAIYGIKNPMDCEELPSKGYIELTKKVLSDFKYFSIGDKLVSPKEYVIEGDYSNLAPFLILGAIDKVEVTGLNPNSIQGDRYILEILKNVGANVKIENDLIQVSKNELNPINIDGSLVPDLVPPLAILLTKLNGISRIDNIGYLRNKESNRLDGIKDIINILGGKAKVEGDSLIVEKGDLKEGKVSSQNDHRILFSLAIAEKIYDIELDIDDRGVVTKSFPNFWEVMNG